MCQILGFSMLDMAGYYQSLYAWISFSWKCKEPRYVLSHHGVRICAGAQCDTREALAGCMVLDTNGILLGNHHCALENLNLSFSVPQFPCLFNMCMTSTLLRIREPC